MQLQNVPSEITEQLGFQQDRPPPHYGKRVKDYLNVRFDDRWIGRGGLIAWPPRCPDLDTVIFSLGIHKNDYVPKLTRYQKRIREEFMHGTSAILTNIQRAYTEGIKNALKWLRMFLTI